jgi:hypothetical protein
MRGDATAEVFGLPPIHPWIRNLMIGLFGLYVAELIGVNAVGQGLYSLLALHPVGDGFAPWQLLTRYLVQGPQVMSVMFGLLMLYFALPLMDRFFSRSQLLQVLAAMFVGGTVLSLGLAALGIVGGLALGWGMVLTGLFALVGLAMPSMEFRLFFLIPVRASYFVWGAGVIAGLLLLASPSLSSADYLGSWLGVVAWWYLLGPGGRRRKLIQQSKKIEKELMKFQVIQGGRNRDDDIVH